MRMVKRPQIPVSINPHASMPTQPPFRNYQQPGEVEITRFEMQRVFEGREEGLAVLLGYLYCANCETPGRHIVEYRVFVNRLDDLVLRGRCSACSGPAGRYLETGEDPVLAERIQAMVREGRSMGR